MNYKHILASVFLCLATLTVVAAEAESKSKGSSNWVSQKPLPMWIWRADKTDNEPIFLRKSFELPENFGDAKLYFTCDNGADAYLNGKKVGTAPDWANPVHVTKAKSSLQSGKNTIAVKAHNRGGVAAFVLKLEVKVGEQTFYVQSDLTWKLSLKEEDDWQSTAFDDAHWNGKLIGHGNFGVAPWGIPGSGGAGGNPLDTEQIYVPPGFKVELLYEVPRGHFKTTLSIITYSPSVQILQRGVRDILGGRGGGVGSRAN